jgi:dUTP pyrophosphatase
MVLRDKEAKETEIKIQQHLQEIRRQAFRIGVQVLEVGDTYTIKTGEGEETVTVDAAGKLPSKKNVTDAGFDLFTPYDVVLAPGEVKKVPLNIRMQLPAGSWARIETKSGLGSKGMLVYAGVVDQDYRGIPHVIMTNMNYKDDKPIVVKAGEKLAQMTMNPHRLEFFVERVESVDTNTARGEGGFGSTGRV